MPHIHDLIDYTVALFVVFEGKILLIKHKKLSKWLPIGGHIELDEDPDEALWREMKEECGLDRADVTPLGEKIELKSEGTKFLLTPNRLDIHKISDSHRHVAFIYYFTSRTDQVRLEVEAHDEICWVAEDEMDSLDLDLSPAIKTYCREAMKLVDMRSR